MDAIECMRTRQSVRKFKDRAVETEKIEAILDAARYAPSAGNLQDRRFIVVLDEGARKKLAEVCLQQWWMETAPVHIVVCSEWKQNKRMYGPRGEQYAHHGAAAAMQNILLAAHAEGLAACWVGAFEDEQLRRALDIPGDVLPVAVAVIGYPDETPAPQSKACILKLSFYNKWGQEEPEPEPLLEGAMRKAKSVAQKVEEKVRNLKE